MRRRLREGLLRRGCKAEAVAVAVVVAVAVAENKAETRLAKRWL